MRKLVLPAVIVVLALAGCGKSNLAQSCRPGWTCYAPIPAFTPSELIGMELSPAEELAREHGRYVEQVAPLPPHDTIGYLLPPKAIYVETKAFTPDGVIVRLMALRCSKPNYKGKCSFVPAS
jgi:hypothetical protein